jgi:hypothetical protein
MTDDLPPEETAHSGRTWNPVPYMLDPNTGFLIPYVVNSNTGNLAPYVPAGGPADIGDFSPIGPFIPGKGYPALYVPDRRLAALAAGAYAVDHPDVDASEELDYSKLLHSFFPDTIPDDKFLNSDDAARYFAEFLRDVLNTQASTGDYANLAGQLEKVKNNEGAQEATDRIGNGTPFTSVADKIHEVNHQHGPGWGAWLAGLAIPVVLQLSGWLGQSPPPTPPPEQQIIISVNSEDVPTVPAPAPTPASAAINLLRATENTTESTYSLADRLTGPPDVTVIINILRNLGSSQFNQLSSQQQYKFTQRMFAEMGKIVSQQSNVSAGLPEQSDISPSDD